MKEFLAITATLLIFIGYTPYFKDILKEKTRPHVYTWFISGFITFIAFGLQLQDHAGSGAIPTFFGAAAGIAVFILSLRYKRASITKSDTFFFVMALFATALWLGADQAVTAVIIISLVDVLAFIPTIRKSWRNPEQETLSTYYVNALRFTISVIAVEHYTLVTVLYPASALFVDGSFCLFLALRRRALAKQLPVEPQSVLIS